MPRQVLEVHTFEHAHFMYHWFLSMTPRPGFITYYLRRFHLNGNHFVTKTARSRRVRAPRTRHAKEVRKNTILLPAADEGETARSRTQRRRTLYYYDTRVKYLVRIIRVPSLLLLLLCTGNDTISGRGAVRSLGLINSTICDCRI